MILKNFSWKLCLVSLIAVVCALFAPARAAAAETPPKGKGASTNAVTARLQSMITKINAKLQSGKRSAEDLAEDMKAFDAFIAERPTDKSPEMAQVVWMKAMLYLQVLDDSAKARETILLVQKNFPGTPQAKQAGEVLPQLDKMDAMKAIQKTLVVGNPFPDFQEKDLDGKPLSVSRFKGKVLLVDFWATWCGPCRVELPNVIATYEKHHKNGFEILGISLDQDEQAMKKFLASNKMTWPQYFDGLGWQTKLAGQYGVNSIPATYLLDAQGIIIARDLRGDDLEEAVAAALKKK
jgi:thiol-disulfide isomerase/thioredoxin